MNGLQYGTPYAGKSVGNRPKLTPLYNILNTDILNTLHLHYVLRHFVLDGEVTDEEERIMRFSFSTPKEITRALKRIRESITGTPYSVSIINDVDLALKALEIVIHSNGSAVEGIADNIGHI